MSRSSFAAFVAAVILIAGCPRRPPAPAPAASPAARACASNADCAGGWVCLDGKCSDMRAGAVYLNTDNAVRPTLVRNEVDRIQKAHEVGVDKAMKMPE
jgi:hypothetical protein